MPLLASFVSVYVHLLVFPATPIQKQSQSRKLKTYRKSHTSSRASRTKTNSLRLACIPRRKPVFSKKGSSSDSQSVRSRTRYSKFLKTILHLFKRNVRKKNLGKKSRPTKSLCASSARRWRRAAVASRCLLHTARSQPARALSLSLSRGGKVSHPN